MRVSDRQVFGRSVVVTKLDYRYLVRGHLEEIGVDAKIQLEPAQRASASWRSPSFWGSQCPKKLPFAWIRNWGQDHCRCASGLAVKPGVGNLIAAIRFALEAQSACDQTFVVADANPVSLAEIVSILRAARGRAAALLSVPTVFLEGPLRLICRSDIWDRLGVTLVVELPNYGRLVGGRK